MLPPDLDALRPGLQQHVAVMDAAERHAASSPQGRLATPLVAVLDEEGPSAAMAGKPPSKRDHAP